MFEVLSNETITPVLHRMVIRAPRIAAARKPGQFVIIRAAEGEERIPLTIADADANAGTITHPLASLFPLRLATLCVT
jgi:ferredoxin--NADP+ reductase